MIDDRFKSFQKRSNEDVTWGVNDEIGFILYIFMGFWEGHLLNYSLDSEAEKSMLRHRVVHTACYKMQPHKTKFRYSIAPHPLLFLSCNSDCFCVEISFFWRLKNAHVTNLL